MFQPFFRNLHYGTSNMLCIMAIVICFVKATFITRLAETPNASEINVAFTKHITNAIMQIREEKLKHEASIPKKLEDGWEPIIIIKVEEFYCNAICDLGASISVMPRKIYDMLDLPPLEK